MEDESEFLSLILDSISEHIAVIDETGEIRYVNERWNAFGIGNQYDEVQSLVGANYLSVCDQATLAGDEFGEAAAKGIRSVIGKHSEEFYFEYPCHSTYKKRWFMMRITPFQLKNRRYFVLVHQDVTERKLAEEKVNVLARVDSLTNLPNRRALDEFLLRECQQQTDVNGPIVLALLDLDYFKQLNDSYGHQSGDICLYKIGKLLQTFMHGRDGMSARYGGEEFLIVLKNTQMDHAVDAFEQLLTDISGLKIPNVNASSHGYVTASIGVAELLPSKKNRPEDIIKKADAMLYKAKALGRNQVIYSS